MNRMLDRALVVPVIDRRRVSRSSGPKNEATWSVGAIQLQARGYYGDRWGRGGHEVLTATRLQAGGFDGPAVTAWLACRPTTPGPSSTRCWPIAPITRGPRLDLVWSGPESAQAQFARHEPGAARGVRQGRAQRHRRRLRVLGRGAQSSTAYTSAQSRRGWMVEFCITSTRPGRTSR